MAKNTITGHADCKQCTCPGYYPYSSAKLVGSVVSQHVPYHNANSPARHQGVTYYKDRPYPLPPGPCSGRVYAPLDIPFHRGNCHFHSRSNRGRTIFVFIFLGINLSGFIFIEGTHLERILRLPSLQFSDTFSSCGLQIFFIEFHQLS